MQGWGEGVTVMSLRSSPSRIFLSGFIRLFLVLTHKPLSGILISSIFLAWGLFLRYRLTLPEFFV